MLDKIESEEHLNLSLLPISFVSSHHPYIVLSTMYGDDHYIEMIIWEITHTQAYWAMGHVTRIN
jgi:hypothetical protein